MDSKLTYDGMRHRFAVTRLIGDAMRRYGQTASNLLPSNPFRTGLPSALRTETAVGTPIRKQDATGRWYFMPVTLHSSLGALELPCAAISLTSKKRIVETSLSGRRGTVHELVSVESYAITLSAILIGEDGNYPEEEVLRLRNLYELNEAIELESALSDLVLGNDDRIILETIEFPTASGSEATQPVHMTASTDASVELIVE